MTIPVRTDERKDAKHKRPDCSLTGWAAAWSLLERVNDDTQRNTLANLTRKGGIQGGPAMKHLAGSLRWLTGLSDYPVPAASMDGATVAFVEARARALLTEVDRSLFPKMREDA